MIRAVQRSTDETNAEFESRASPSSDEHPNPTKVHLCANEPTDKQPPLVPANGDSELWLYKDALGCVHGPYSDMRMAYWFASGCFFLSLPVKRICDQEFQPLGQVIKAWGRLPFLRPLPSVKDGDTEDPQASTLACPTDKIVPPSDSNSWKGKTASCKGLQERPLKVVGVTAKPSATGQPPSAAARQCASEGLDRAPLGYRDVLPSSFNKRAGSNAKAQPFYKGAWGGYEKCLPAAQSFKPVVTPPTPKIMNRRQPAAPPAPLTWAEVCQRALDKPSCTSGPVRQEPVAIENMARFPSLGGKAFTDSMQKKNQAAGSRHIVDGRDFTRWSYDMLRNLSSYIHVPTFLELLKDVESSAEIEEYVRMHLGNGQEALRFAREYVQRRAQWKQQTGVPGLGGATQPRGANVNFGAASKGRKKMQKLNGSAFGFAVKSAACKK
ncbi:hypothetical protein V5799_028035 [Amblyomma americanum]|uniref:GYF domain-containing protein n=1 Tax=Amblyomma americanum TaxID=6943 RepID=A0AAQ4DE09_AMBAM